MQIVSRHCTASLVLFSGLAADRRLLRPQLRALPAEVPAWLDPIQNEPVVDYARRMAVAVRSRPPLVLAGVSFGAMIALEAARVMPASAVVMISGGRSGHVVNPI